MTNVSSCCKAPVTSCAPFPADMLFCSSCGKPCTVNASTVEEIRNVFKIMFKDTMYDFHNDEDLDRVFDFFIPFLSDSTLREVRDEMEMLRKMKGSSKSIAEAEFKSAYCQGVLDSEAIITKRLEKRI